MVHAEGVATSLHLLEHGLSLVGAPGDLQGVENTTLALTFFPRVGTHFTSGYISLAKASHMAPPNFRRCSPLLWPEERRTRNTSGSRDIYSPSLHHAPQGARPCSTRVAPGYSLMCDRGLFSRTGNWFKPGSHPKIYGQGSQQLYHPDKLWVQRMTVIPHASHFSERKSRL